jgi:large subunit ribosomal protein L19e
MTFDLSTQKRIAGSILKAAPKRVRFDPTRLNDIKAAITKVDLGRLISEGVISAIPARGVSRVRARKIAKQKAKGLRQGPGSLEGKATARAPAKLAWMSRIRAQREFIQELREKEIVTNDSYRILYGKSKGGFFRSIRHIKIYINEQNLAVKPAKSAPATKTAASKAAKTE